MTLFNILNYQLKKMFYLRLNKLRINSNGNLLGSSEVQLMSFVTLGEAVFPLLNDFYRTSVAALRRNLIAQDVSRSSQLTHYVRNTKGERQSTHLFGDTGYKVLLSETFTLLCSHTIVPVRSF